MMALLIRHGHTEAVGQWLAGRGADPPLSRTGRLEAEALSAALSPFRITAVYSSPLSRALETARPLARNHRVVIRLREALTDVDFGAWTARTLDSLAHDRTWQAFNRNRRDACSPRGEPLAAVQRRIVDELIGLSRVHAGARERIAVVTHAEPIRCALAAVEGKSLDEVLDVEISTAHVSIVSIGPGVRQVISVNVTPDDAAARVFRPYI
jgi:broad specificity phosphatase PhoE